MLAKSAITTNTGPILQAVTALYASAEREHKKSRLQSRQLLVSVTYPMFPKQQPTQPACTFTLLLATCRSANFSGFCESMATRRPFPHERC